MATKDDEAARTQLLQTLISEALDGGTSKAQVLPANLAQRELPPGNWSQLYVLYQAWCLASSSRCASRPAFYACSKQWRKALRFRPHSKHSVCQLCDKMKSRMKHATNFMDHAKATDELLGHLSNMWQCRQVYWLAREKSRAKQDLLTIIYDGFDKAKPAIPRWSRGQAPKQASVERVPRTHLAVSATLAHGYGCVIFMAEEGVSTGGNYSWSCILKTIDLCAQAARRAGKQLARSLWVQSDNTVKELKNSLSGSMLTSLISADYFDEAGHHHLPVGHTHEDIDGLFGLLSNILQTCGDSLQTPADMARIFESKVTPVFAERNEFLEVVMMDRAT